MRGVDIEQFFLTQQELNDTFETGSLGYRGLVGPPTRRPSGIVARLYERMLRKSSGPTICSSFENPPGPSHTVEPLTLKLPHPEALVESEELAVTPTNNNQPACSFGAQTSAMMPPTGSRNSSLASSRRSSLRRQECVDEETVASAEPAEEILCQQSEQSSGFISGRMLANASQILPTVYVTPPPSTIFSQASLDMPESVTTHEVYNFFPFLFMARGEEIWLNEMFHSRLTPLSLYCNWPPRRTGSVWPPPHFPPSLTKTILAIGTTIWRTSRENCGASWTKRRICCRDSSSDSLTPVPSIKRTIPRLYAAS